MAWYGPHTTGRGPKPYSASPLSTAQAKNTDNKTESGLAHDFLDASPQTEKRKLGPCSNATQEGERTASFVTGGMFLILQKPLLADMLSIAVHMASDGSLFRVAFQFSSS